MGWMILCYFWNSILAHYVYILKSDKDGTFYKGYTTQPLIRFQQHNDKESEYTSTKVPWTLVYVEELPTKREALIRERNLKKASLDRLNQLLDHPKNIVKNFLDRLG